MNPHATHIPLLAAAINRTRGPVLELGTGDYSTPLISALCRGDRMALSVENDIRWAKRFLDLDRKGHRIVTLTMTDAFKETSTPQQADFDAWENFTGIDEHEWSVVFVDHRPAARRKDDIIRVANNAELVVVHDSEERAYGYEHAFSHYTQRFDYTRFSTHTTVLSNAIDVARFI